MSELDPIVLEALAESLRAAALGWLIFASILILIALGLVRIAVVYYKDDPETSRGMIVATIVIILFSMILIGFHMDDLIAPQYEAMKKLHNQQLLSGHQRLP